MNTLKKSTGTYLQYLYDTKQHWYGTLVYIHIHTPTHAHTRCGWGAEKLFY